MKKVIREKTEYLYELELGSIFLDKIQKKKRKVDKFDLKL